MLWIAMVIGLTAVGFSDCVENQKAVSYNSNLVPTEIPNPIYEVEYFATVDNGIPYLNVKVVGKSQDYKIILSDNDGSTTGIVYIKSDDLIDGVETVKVKMNEYGKTPKAGTYTLLIKQTLPEKIVYATNATFKGALINIIDTDFLSQKYCYGSCYYTITNVKFTIKNFGDIPAIIDYALIGIGGDESPASPCPTKSVPLDNDRRYRVIDRQESKIYLKEGIAPNESKEITGNTYIFDLRSGYRYPIDIDLYSEQEPVDGSTEYFSAGCKE